MLHRQLSLPLGLLLTGSLLCLLPGRASAQASVLNRAVRSAPNHEPAIPRPEQDAATEKALAALRERTGWQYLMVEPGSSELVDPTNGKTDRQGLGLFARAAVADASTNPVRSSVSAGLAMRGMLPGRDSDTAGLGISYADIRDEPLLTGSLLDSSARRAELYYSFAFSPSAQLTLDYQWVDSMLGRVEPAELLGLRLRLQF